MFFKFHQTQGICVVANVAAGRLCVLLFFCCCVHVHVTLICSGVRWGGMWTFMCMLRWSCYVDDVQGRGGILWGGMLMFIYMLTMHRSWQPWANCFTARSSFWKEKKEPAELDAHLQGELDTETLKTTRRLSVPFPSYICLHTIYDIDISYISSHKLDGNCRDPNDGTPIPRFLMGIVWE